MNGTSYFLDTNAIISLLNGNIAIENLLQKATWIGTSVICIIEFLSFSNLSSFDRGLLYTLSQRIQVISIENTFSELEQIANLRQKTRLRLPDAVIAATALANRATLITNDKHFSSISNLAVISF